MTFPGTDYHPNQLKLLRDGLMSKLSQKDIPTDKVAQQLAQIAQTLSHSASNDPTAFEGSVARSGATSSANLLERQVESALTQVLGRAPGRGPEGFISALNAAFPTDVKGQVVFTPARSVVSLHSLDGNEAKLTGQLSVEQANLYRQVSVMATDAIRVLEGLNPFVPTADADAVEALRALLHSEIESLVQEFGRLDKPRSERVETYIKALKTHLQQFGEVAHYSSRVNICDQETPSGNESSSSIVTIDDEAQIAGYGLLNNYIDTFEKIWDTYKTPKISGSYSEKLAGASVMLPVIADSNISFMSAMDSIGFTEGERRASRFSELTNHPDSQLYLLLDNINIDNIRFKLPEITVNDLNEWIDRFATIESPATLATSGRYGLESVTDQADTLFWVIGLVLDYVDYGSKAQSPEKQSMLKQLLSYERVRKSLNELHSQLQILADLSPCISPNVNMPQQFSS